MARFLFTVWPFLGHLHPHIAIAHALHRRGHEAAFYTGASAQSIVKEEGFHYFPFQRIDERRVEHIVLSPHGIPSNPKNPFRLKAMWRDWVLGTVPMQLADLEGVLASWSPDVVVCDQTMWGPFLILNEARHIPIAVFSIIPACLLSGRDAPIRGFPLPPPRTWFERLRARLLRNVVDLFLADVRREASALRQGYGLPPLRTSVTDFAGQMPLYIVPCSPEFDYERRDLPPSVEYVGPCLWDKRHNEPPPTWLEHVPRDRPLIHVTEGTIHVHEPFLLRAVAQAFRDGQVQVVMTTGRHRDPAELGLGPLPPHIRVERYVPHSDLLPRTAAVVTMGGAGTVLAALTAGVPLVIVPTEWDKPENARRVVAAGAGLRVEQKRCTPERIRTAVERVLSEPSFRQNAKRLAVSFARCGGPPRAAELLEGLALLP